MILAAVIGIVVVIGGGVLVLATTTHTVGPVGSQVSGAKAIAQSRVDDAAPAAFRNRSRTRSCGEVVLGQGDAIPVAARSCLAAGVTSGAELAIAAPTTEGDPIVSFYLVGPGITGVDVYTNNTFDSFGSGKWARSTCSAPRIDEHGLCA